MADDDNRRSTAEEVAFQLLDDFDDSKPRGSSIQFDAADVAFVIDDEDQDKAEDDTFLLDHDDDRTMNVLSVKDLKLLKMSSKVEPEEITTPRSDAKVKKTSSKSSKSLIDKEFEADEADEDHDRETDDEEEAAEEEEEEDDEEYKEPMEEEEEEEEYSKKESEDQFPFERRSRTKSLAEERHSVISKLRELFDERRSLRLKNGFLHKKYLDSLKTRKASKPSVQKPLETLPSRTNEGYQMVLEEYNATKVHVDSTSPLYEAEIDAMRSRYSGFLVNFQRAFGELLIREEEVGSAVASTRTGKGLGEREVKRLLERQQARVVDLATTRVVYLKLRNRLADVNAKLDVLVNFGGYCTPMEYEGMLVSKRIAADKVEDREEEINKIRKKCFTCVSILAHFKESSNSLTNDVSNTKLVLDELAEVQRQHRFNANKGRLIRDSLRKRYDRFKGAVGILDHSALLYKLDQDIAKHATMRTRLQLLRDEIILQHRTAASMKAYLKRRKESSRRIRE